MTGWLQTMPQDDIGIGDKVKVCHKSLRVVRVGSEQVTLRGELAEIHGQEIVASKEYAHEHRIQK